MVGAGEELAVKPLPPYFVTPPESHEARAVESSGRLVQERLQHYIDQVGHHIHLHLYLHLPPLPAPAPPPAQVEVSIAGQVASKSHHFFQVMTYHDALMCQVRLKVVFWWCRRWYDPALAEAKADGDGDADAPPLLNPPPAVGPDRGGAHPEAAARRRGGGRGAGGGGGGGLVLCGGPSL